MAELSYTINETDKKSAEISFSGEFVLSYIEPIKEDFTKEINNYEKIEINPEQIEEIDLPGIQFIYSLKKSFEKNGGIFLVKKTFNKTINELISRNGFYFLSK